MKTKDLKKQIKEDIYSLTPDVISKIDFKSIKIEEKEEALSARKKSFKLSYMFTSVLAFSLVLFLILNVVVTPGPVIETRRLSFETKEEIYTLSTFSSVALLYQNKKAAEMLSSLALSETQGEELLINSHINTLNQYLNFLEPIITNSDALTFEIKASTLAGYEKQITFTSVLLSEEAVVYTLYYNETKQGSSVLIEGVMLFLTEEYVFSGSLKTLDGVEEFKLKAFQKNNALNYIEVKQKKENNKQKFQYSVYENEGEIFESEIKIELQNGNVLIELDYESQSKEISFEIIKQSSSNTIYVEYEIETDVLAEEGVIVISVVLDPITKKNIYHYQILSNEYEFEFDKDRIFDQEDDDEDEIDDDETEEDDD